MKVRSPAVICSALFALVAACGHASVSSPAPVSVANPLVIIVMENHERGDVTASAPFQRSMLIHGRDYAQYYAVAHPSLPNYLAIASGSTGGKTTDDITAGELPGSTLWDQLTAAHV